MGVAAAVKLDDCSRPVLMRNHSGPDREWGWADGAPWCTHLFRSIASILGRQGGAAAARYLPFSARALHNL